MIINIAHTKGGVGKSTLATNLAVEMNCPILDLDMQKSSYFFNELRELPKLTIFKAKTRDELKLLEPYGKANPEPLFGTKNVEIKCISIIGKNKNVIKLVLSQDSIEFSGIIFTNFDKYIEYLNEKFKTNDIISEQNNIKDKFIDILYTPIINEYMNTKSIQLLIKDIR